MKGLVIDDPWISLILSGRKTWEMRSRPTSIRGRIALIKKGTGTIVGLADLMDCIGPFDAISWRAHADKHCIPVERGELAMRWNVAWVLDRAAPLARPVNYAHPSGAVTWVNLDDEVVAQLQLGASYLKIPQKLTLTQGSNPPRKHLSAQLSASEDASAPLNDLLVPIAIRL
ncbi:ASCH domain-containing protein [Stenotrophomonas maltophilia]